MAQVCKGIGYANRRVRLECLAWGPVDGDEAPVLLVEGVVRERATARRNTTSIMCAGGTLHVLPPLVCKLKDQAANARRVLLAVPDDLLCQGHCCLGLVGLVERSSLGVERVCAELSYEHRLLTSLDPEVKEVAECKARDAVRPQTSTSSRALRCSGGGTIPYTVVTGCVVSSTLIMCATLRTLASAFANDIPE
eukprot:CAMPEP_0179186232 /NCGR_PEP_ID=MMETSP0796-20121207/92360_1 /TAXON_ID=73915 /ORGANISM="Pyrodinium bahamense, Strain pbaha01" /LENGTH=193 /DNA_ID=CAMNT_0020890209 /DNA_START=1509 /DNA_END=2091 /DNA_ORIENTATION=+